MNDSDKEIDSETHRRIWRKVEIRILAHNREFLNALAWVASEDELLDAGGGQGYCKAARRLPPAEDKQ